MRTCLNALIARTFLSVRGSEETNSDEVEGGTGQPVPFSLCDSHAMERQQTSVIKLLTVTRGRYQ